MNHIGFLTIPTRLMETILEKYGPNVARVVQFNTMSMDGVARIDFRDGSYTYASCNEIDTTVHWWGEAVESLPELYANVAHGDWLVRSGGHMELYERDCEESYRMIIRHDHSSQV